MRWLILSVIFLLAQPGLRAQEFSPGQTYFGDNDYIEYQAGNLPIVLTAPHGGELQPAAIPDRDCSGCVYINDAFTQELARELADALHERTGCYPHLIINRLHRRKLDANRAVIEAADGDPLAGQAWMDFHDFTSAAHDEVESATGRGLHLDLHGHAHSIQRLELGYLLTASELREEDEVLDGGELVEESSIRTLVGDNLDALTHAELLRGAYSLGTLLEDRGFDAVPSEPDPFPVEGQAYFSGGYNTDRYGSDSGGPIDAIQVECNQDVRFSPTTRRRFADSLAESVLAYLALHYFEAVPCAPSAVEAVAGPALLRLFPNPASGQVYFEWDGQGPVEIIQVYDPLGRMVRTSARGAGRSLSVAGLPPGIYGVVLLEKGRPVARGRVAVAGG